MSCTFPDCDRPVEKSGLCAGHRKQKNRGQKLTPLNDAIARRLTPAQNLHEAGISVADAPDDDDDEYNRRVDKHKKAAITFARQHQVTQTLNAFDRRRAAGLRIGRPPKLTAAEVQTAVEQAGGIRAAAKLLRMSRNTVRAALKRNP